jgi:hypothetical protein
MLHAPASLPHALGRRVRRVRRVARRDVTAPWRGVAQEQDELTHALDKTMLQREFAPLDEVLRRPSWSRNGPGRVYPFARWPPRVCDCSLRPSRSAIRRGRQYGIPIMSSLISTIRTPCPAYPHPLFRLSLPLIVIIRTPYSDYWYPLFRLLVPLIPVST